jgi:hypothetical protein
LSLAFIDESAVAIGSSGRAAGYLEKIHLAVTAKPPLWRVADEEFRQGSTKHFGRQNEGFIVVPALDVCGN